MHIYPLLVIVAGLLSKSPGGVAETPEAYNICSGSGHNKVRVNAASSPFTIRSQEEGIPYYDNNLDCPLVLQSGTQPLVLSFQFGYFYLEENCFCDLDSLCLDGVLYCSSSFSGRRLYYILPARKEFTVHFHTDASVNMSGFHLFVTTSPLAEGQKVDQPIGRGNNLAGVCSVPTTYHSDRPYRDGCKQFPPSDTTYPSIYTDGGNENSTTTEEASTPAEQQEYDFYYLSHGQQSTIAINTSSSPFLILSPNYGSGSYFDSQFCSLVLRSGAQPLVLHMDIKDFDLESHSNCSYDSLCVGGVTLCGHSFAGYRLQFILPAYSDFTVSFRTDGSGVYRGFKIEVSQVLAARQIVHQPQSGIVSYNGTLAYTDEKYRSGYSYSDRCPRFSFTTP